MTSSGFTEFLNLDKEEREGVFVTAADRLGTSGAFIEKDFWVCLVIDLLFNRLPGGHLDMCFKGGTSLSKVYGLIGRFSEDIDVTLDPEPLGFTGDRAFNQPGISGKRRETLREELRPALLTYVQERLAPALTKVAEPFNLRIEMDEGAADEDGANLLLFYPALIDEGRPQYVGQRVKIELGARTALEPLTPSSLAPYIDELDLELDFGVTNVPTIVAERTFWEKVLILHGWRSGYDGEPVRMPKDRQRVSRHYYDVAQIAPADVADNALSDLGLLNRAREQDIQVFGRAWRKIDGGTSWQLPHCPSWGTTVCCRSGLRTDATDGAGPGARIC